MAVSTATDFTKIPLVALRTKTRYTISQMLNGYKVIPSPTGLPRDWRGLAHISKMSLPPANSCDPIKIILESWIKSQATFEDLIEAFKELDRWDVYYDTISSIESDANMYLTSKDSEQNVLAANVDVDNLILTVDDIKLTQEGMDPQIYDAFLLYSDADEGFAMEMVDKLENEYGLKLCLKDRDLVGGVTFEHEAIMRLISERCNRLIIIVSPSFLDSPANKFFVTFAQALGIRQGQRKIIPCIYKKITLPQQLSYYYILDYTRKSQWWDFWKILSKSIISSPGIDQAKSNSQAVCIKEIREEEDENQLAIDIRKPENWNCPIKRKNITELKNGITEQHEHVNASAMNFDESEIQLSVKSGETVSSSPKSSTRSLFKKILPKSLKGKSKSKTTFNKKKKALSG